MRTLLITSAVLLTAFAPAPLPRRERGRDHQAQLVGDWHIRTIKWRGSDAYQAASLGDTTVMKSDLVVISRGQITFRGADDRAVTLKLSGSGEVRFLDLERATWQQPVLGLYKLERGLLLLSYGIDGTRPK